MEDEVFVTVRYIESKVSSRGEVYALAECVGEDGSPVRLLGFGPAAQVVLRVTPGDRLGLTGCKTAGRTFIASSPGSVSLMRPAGRVVSQSDAGGQEQRKWPKDLTQEEAEDLKRRLRLLSSMVESQKSGA